MKIKKYVIYKEPLIKKTSLVKIKSQVKNFDIIKKVKINGGTAVTPDANGVADLGDYLPIVLTGTLTGNDSTASVIMYDNRITDDMRPYIEYNGDTTVISGEVTMTVDTGELTVSAKLTGTIGFTVTLVKIDT